MCPGNFKSIQMQQSKSAGSTRTNTAVLQKNLKQKLRQIRNCIRLISGLDYSPRSISPNFHCHCVHALSIPWVSLFDCLWILQRFQIGWNLPLLGIHLALYCTASKQLSPRSTVRAALQSLCCKNDQKDARDCHFWTNIWKFRKSVSIHISIEIFFSLTF